MNALQTREKKGLGLEALVPAVSVIIIIGIALGIGLFVLNQTADAISSTSITVSEENFTVTAVAVDSANSAECGFSDMAISSVSNDSTQLDSGNYTFSASEGSITNASAEDYGNVWTVNYTYLGSNDDTYCTSVTTTVTGLGGIATWISVIVVVLAAAIVLGIVLSSFGARKTGV